jgi:hypothetical protein
MINGFEEQTEALSKYERDILLPMFIKALSKKIGKNNSVTASKMTEGLQKNYGIKVDGPRIRKIINHIRNNSLVPGLIATNSGYWVSEDPEEIKAWILGMEQRIGAQVAIKKNMELYLLKILNYEGKAEGSEAGPEERK